MLDTRPDKHIEAARSLARHLGKHLQIDAVVRLWDGSRIPLNTETKRADELHNPVELSIAGSGVVASLLRWPTLDRLIQHYIHGDISVSEGDLIRLAQMLGDNATRKRLRRAEKKPFIKALWPFLFAARTKPGRGRAFSGDITGEGRAQATNQDYIQFHYDVGNDFYRLILDPWMQYSCAYFRDWNGNLEQAQTDKLDMICRKLRLKPGERFLDIGCGWGGLACYAAEKYGVRAHGITLSPSQLEIAKSRIAERGLGHLVTVEIKDYADLTGTYDKIASIGMYEHIGIANIPLYIGRVKALLASDGLFLNHAISRRAKRKAEKFAKRPEHRALLKYIFPGGELDDIGHTLAAFEAQGFEVHDVEGWRHHYAATTRHWYERLTARRDEAIAIAGIETYRIWAAYLAGCSIAFERGSARIYQTLVSRTSKTGPVVPPTREDLYR